MKHLTNFESHLILEAKPYTADNFRLFTQIIGKWLQREFEASGGNKDEFIRKLPFYDANYNVSVDIKKSNRPISLSDVEEQETDNFNAYMNRNSKFTLLSSNFLEALTHYGSFIFRLPQKLGVKAVNILKKNFPKLEVLMNELIKRKVKPVTSQIEVDDILSQTEMPRVIRRGRKPGSKNKPKEKKLFKFGDTQEPKPGISSDAEADIKRGILKLEDEVEILNKELDEVMAPYVQKIRQKMREIESRKKILGID